MAGLFSDENLPLPVSAELAKAWKHRCGPSGLHLFERRSGLNVLLDEIEVPRALWSRAPRQVSIALTNRCDLACEHCYAPKSRDQAAYQDLTSWIAECDANGSLGVGFGGGEPTLYPGFSELCQFVERNTKLAVTFTTHGHHISEALADDLCGAVHFIRVSMDGVGETYEAIRGKSFSDLLERLRLIRRICHFGVNIVVNDRTLHDLDQVATIAEDFGAREILLLPQRAVQEQPGVDRYTLGKLQRWVDDYRGAMKLCISEASAYGFPTCEPLLMERGLHAYAHIDAVGMLKPDSHGRHGVPIGNLGVLGALEQLSEKLAVSNL